MPVEARLFRSRLHARAVNLTQPQQQVIPRNTDRGRGRSSGRGRRKEPPDPRRITEAPPNLTGGPHGWIIGHRIRLKLDASAYPVELRSR